MTLPVQETDPIIMSVTDDSMIARPSDRGDQTQHDVAGSVPSTGPMQQMNLVNLVTEASLALSRSSRPEEAIDELLAFASAISGSPCTMRKPGSAVHPGSWSVEVADCTGAIRGSITLARRPEDEAHRRAIIAIAGHAGTVLGCHALRETSAKDVADRQVAEFEVERLRKLFDRRLDEALGERGIWAEVFKGSQYGVCIIGLDLRYLSFNPAFEEWFSRHGVMPPMQGQRVVEALSGRPEVFAEAEACWRRALDGEDFTHSWRIVSRGKEFHYETRYTPLLDEAGQRKGAVQFSIDITERVEERRRLEVAEAALRQSQKMEAVGKLTGGIAHDFNNILTGIVGALDLIGRKMIDGKIDAVPRYLDMAVTSANRAASLTHRLLAFSRRQPVDPRLTDVDALVLGMGEMIARAMGPDVVVETSTSAGSAQVLCDASQLESAIMNLVINSREALPSGGRLIIATGTIEMDDTPFGDEIRPGLFVRIAISDNGTGMTPEVLSRAIEPFFTTKGIGNGTGLGLSMVYGFAHQSGGFLDMRSDEAEGTTVSIYLPATAVLPVVEDDRAGPVCASPGATVLVVEDEPAVRAIVVEILQDMGCTVIEAEDGGQGATLLTSDARIDVLVTDIGLPVLNGRQVATVARSVRPDIPILFMTGYSDNATITEGFRGRTRLVTKPFRPAQFAEALGGVLESC